MLQQAYLARKASEDALLSLDQRFSQYQKENPHATSFLLELSDTVVKAEIESIAFHFSKAGYDVTSTVVGNNLIIDWKSAEEGRTGSININNDFFTFSWPALYPQKNEE